jgi:hypothetical protein
MLHVSGLFRADPSIQAAGDSVAAKYFSPAEISSFGLDVHAGVSETSAMLALRPDLVPDSYKNLPPQVGHTRAELQATAHKPGWQGYLSSPARATAAYGHAVEAWWVDGLSNLILRAVRGEDFSKAPRAPGRLDAATASLVGKALEDERAFEARLAKWLASRPRD